MHKAKLLIASSSNYTVAYETKRQPSYLTIKALGNGTLTYQRTSYPIEYSLNDGDWTAYSSAVTLSNGDSIKFRGTNPNFSSAKAFNTTFDFDVYGNPLSIIDKDNFQNITDLTTLNNNGQNCLSSFFSGTNVVDASGLELPAQTLARHCYASMFYNCRKLTKAPVLPALTLVDYCYSYMFNQCTSLIDVRMYAENIVTTRALDYWLQNPNYSARLPENVHFVFNIKCPTDFATLSNSYSLNKTLSWYCDEDISNISTTASFEMYNYYDEKSITSSTVPVIASLATSGDRNISDKMSYQPVDNEICSYSNGILKSLLATGTVEHGLRGTITINDILYSVDVPLTINSRTPTSTSFYAKFVSGTYGFPVSSYGYTYQEFVLRDGKNMFVSGLENLELSMRMTFSVGKTPIYAGSAEGVTYSLSTDAYLSINGDNAEYVSSGGPTEITASLGGVTASNTKTVYTKRCTRWVIGDIDSFEPHNPNWSSSRPSSEYVWGYRQTGERETDFSGTISSSYVVIDGSYVDTDLHWWGRYKYGSGNFPDSYGSFEGNSSVNISSSGTSFSISMRTYYTVQFYWQGYYSTFFSEADYQSRYWLCEDYNGQTIQND